MAKSRQEILEMVAQGTINASEAAELLSQATETQSFAEKTKIVEKLVIEDETPKPKQKRAKNAGSSGSRNWLVVRVSNHKTGENRVRVRVPLQVIKIGLKLGSGFVPDLKEVDLEELVRLAESEQTGLLMEMQDDESGEQVQIFIE